MLNNLHTPSNDEQPQLFTLVCRVIAASKQQCRAQEEKASFPALDRQNFSNFQRKLFKLKKFRQRLENWEYQRQQYKKKYKKCIREKKGNENTEQTHISQLSLIHSLSQRFMLLQVELIICSLG